MGYQAPGKCPVCQHDLQITRLSCSHCKTQIEGQFEPCEFCGLGKDELYFLKTFIKCRGNIKDIERELGISYPTVKSKLNQLIESLGFHVPDPELEYVNEDREKEKQQILAELEAGSIDAKQAKDRLAKLKQEDLNDE